MYLHQIINIIYLYISYESDQISFQVPEPSESDLNILESSNNTQGIDSSFIQSVCNLTNI